MRRTDNDMVIAMGLMACALLAGAALVLTAWMIA